jgi:hypothetical protein
MKKIFTLIAALFAVAAVNAQTEVTIDFDNDYKTLFPTITGESSGTGASAVHDGDFTTTTTSTPVEGVTVTVSAKEEGATNDNRIWSSNPRLRMYSGTITIKAATNFKKLVMTVNTNDALVASNNTVNTGTLNFDALAKQNGTIVWEGDAKEVVMSIKGAEEGKWGNTQFHSIVVSFDGSTPTPQPVVIEEIDVTKALEIIAGLGDGAKTDKEYKVTGYIVGDPEFQRKDPAEGQEIGDLYGNVNLKLGATATSTETLTVYRAKDLNNKNFTEETIGSIKAGDVVVFQGLLQKYVKNEVVTPELVSGYLVANTTGIENVAVKAAQNGRTYNLAGQEVGKNFKGIVVKNGKKFMTK